MPSHPNKQMPPMLLDRQTERRQGSACLAPSLNHSFLPFLCNPLTFLPPTGRQAPLPPHTHLPHLPFACACLPCTSHLCHPNLLPFLWTGFLPLPLALVVVSFPLCSTSLPCCASILSPPCDSGFFSFFLIMPWVWFLHSLWPSPPAMPSAPHCLPIFPMCILPLDPCFPLSTSLPQPSLPSPVLYALFALIIPVLLLDFLYMPVLPCFPLYVCLPSPFGFPIPGILCGWSEQMSI